MQSSLTVSPQPARLGRAVRIASLGTALPPLRLSQQEAQDFILSRFNVEEDTKTLYRRVLANKAIEHRFFGLSDLDDVLEKDLDRIQARFEEWAVKLATAALIKALHKAGLAATDLDFLAVTTCTGYVCPGLSAFLVGSCGLRPDVRARDLVGMGCGAAVPALEAAHDFIQTNPNARAAVVCVEICSAAMLSGDAPDLVISNAIFADGAAAAILQDAPAAPDEMNTEAGGLPQICGFSSLTLPAWRESLRFRKEKGFLRNVLGKEVPAQAAEALQEVIDALLRDNNLALSDISSFLFHAGGQKVLDTIQSSLALPPQALLSSRLVLRRHGNMSSPTVLFVLEEEQRRRPLEPGSWGVLAAFGAGFSAHAALLRF